MSKVSKLTNQAMSIGFASKTEAVGCAEFAISGKRTISKDEATKLFADAGDALEVQFKRMESNMQAVVEAEIAVGEHAKRCISSSKDLAAKVGDAMARIDKVVVRDFELKLSQLERFVAAMTTLDELKRNGRLDEMVSAFAHK
jgi:hypothetical protein